MPRPTYRDPRGPMKAFPQSLTDAEISALKAFVALIAQSMRASSSPSANGLHQPNRYQASVHAEDMGKTLERFGVIPSWSEFYSQAMPPIDSTETWNDLIPTKES